MRASTILLFIALLGVITAPPASAQQAAATQPWEVPGITLQATGVAPEEAFRQLGEMAGIAFETSEQRLWSDPQRPGSIDLDIQDQPFWLAVKQICDQANVQVMNDNRPAVRLYSGGNRGLWTDSIVVSSGPVVFVVNGVERNTRTDLRDPVKISREARINIQTFIDPRVRLVQGQKPVAVSEAVDDKGQSLKQQSPDSTGTFQSAWMIHHNLTLALPEELGTRLVKVAGEANFLIDEKTETLEVAIPLEKPVTRKIGGFPLVLSEVKKEGNTYRVKATYNRGSGDKAKYAKTQSLLSDLIRRLELRDEAGNTWRTQGWGSSTSDTERSYDLHMSRDNNEEGEATKVIWPLPTEVREVSFPFEFTDLPLE